MTGFFISALFLCLYDPNSEVLNRPARVSAREASGVISVTNIEKIDWPDVDIICLPSQNYRGEFRVNHIAIKSGRTVRIAFESWSPPIPGLHPTEGLLDVTIHLSPRLNATAQVPIFTNRRPR